MSDEKITALVDNIREYLDEYEPTSIAEQLLTQAADALEASVQAPAVTRGAAIREYVTGDYYRLADQGDSAMLMGSMLDALTASGILQDAAELRGEVLERLLDSVTEPGLVHVCGGEKFVALPVLVSEVRAAAIREGRA